MPQGSPLLDLVQQATTELGLLPPSYVIRSPDNSARQLGALATRIGQMIVRMHDWTDLASLFTIIVPAPIVTQATLTQGSTLLTAIDPAVMTQLRAYQYLATGPGLMTNTRVYAPDVSAGTVAVNMPATLSARETIAFRQDTFPTPVDYSRAINRTHWDRSQRWELRGPQSPQHSEWMRSGIVATGPRRHFRETASAWQIWPPPGDNDGGQVLAGEYISKNWVLSSTFVGQPRFLADADTCYFDDDLMVMGIKWLFFQIKGFASDDLGEEFRRAVTTAAALDGGAPTLDMARQGFPIFLSPGNVPDSGFGNP
jgi:hypothetical protein